MTQWGYATSRCAASPADSMGSTGHAVGSSASTAAPSACCGGLPLRERSTPWRAPAAGTGSRKEHAGSRKQEAAHLAHVRHPLRQRPGARRHVVQQPVGAVDDEVGDQARHHAVRDGVRQGHHRERQERRDGLRKGSRMLQFYLRILACKVDPYWMPMGSWQARAHSTDPSELVQNKQWVYGPSTLASMCATTC